MKKLFFLFAAMLLAAANGYSQTWSYDDGGSETPRNQWAIDAALGKMKGASGVGFSVGARYQYNIHPYVGIDVIGVNYLGQYIKDYGMGPNVLQGLIGVRAKSPYYYEDMAAFVGARFGYGYDVSYAEDGGFACEINLGSYITGHLYAGYTFNLQKLSDIGGKYKFHGFRIGLSF